MTKQDLIEQKLIAGLTPDRMQLSNDSHKHHARGADSHWNLIIVSSVFEGQGPVQRQRSVFGALGSELMASIHSLTMKTLTPAEFEAAGGEVTNPVPPCSHKGKAKRDTGTMG